MTRPALPLLLAAVPLAAQSNSPVVFASIGAFGINSDEGSIGRTVSYSGSVAIPQIYATTCRFRIGSTRIEHPRDYVWQRRHG